MRTGDYRGFTLLELHAAQPTAVTAGGFGPDQLGDLPALGLATMPRR